MNWILAGIGTSEWDRSDSVAEERNRDISGVLLIEQDMEKQVAK